MKLLRVITLLLLVFYSLRCAQNEPAVNNLLETDPHSYAKPNEAVTKHLDLNLKVDFDQKILSGYARWTIENKTGTSQIIFDAKGLNIEMVTLGTEEKETAWQLAGDDKILGSALKVNIESDTKVLTIYYSTPPDAAALGWMEASQTAGKKLPFLFTQGQAILTRTWIPCQDSPGIRISYTASITTPKEMMALMSAENPQSKSADGTYSFKMEQPVSPYLIALAVGDISFSAIGSRTGVYAEPSMLEKTAWEFADMEKMLEAAEKLYGAYPWGRYDLIVLPPGFPFGGMENPRLTFATPTVVTGDRSLVALVAHELAHSWSGNLVTNATWNDFWLNEGFTVYFERRIMEELYGKEYVDMLTQLEHWELLDEIETLGEKSPDTHLHLNLAGRDPDEAGTDIAYQKGALFLQMLENLAGRERFDEFLKGYFAKYKFGAITTTEFLEYLKTNLLEKYQLSANVNEWVYGPGLPDNCPISVSDRFTKIEEAAKTVAQKLPGTKEWTSHEWVHFIRSLPHDLDLGTIRKLDSVYKLSDSGNGEILCVWYEQAINRGYSSEILPRIERFLIEVGRRRFLMPLYRALTQTGQIETARSIYNKAKDGYHAVSRKSVEELLSKKQTGLR